jgi:chromosome segregation protein
MVCKLYYGDNAYRYRGAAVFLKSIELFGFKSFAEKSRLDFSSGITSLLGPNGCGKSNIVDAIKWVLGEQSIKTLRAGKMEDVIFNGTESRKKLNVAEVVLTVSNEHNELPLEVPEIAIKRRMYRSGESEYFINNAQVRLKEVRELFYDTGIGKTAYSILEQGKIDQILSSRPEDRRYVFEEAAGITRYRQRQAEAQRKLDKTEEHLRQVQQILKEVKQTYDSRKVQAQRAQEYKKLDSRIFELEVELQLKRLHALQTRQKERQDQLQGGSEHVRMLEEHQQELQQLIDVQTEKMNDLSKERIEIQTQLHRMDESKNSRKSQLELLGEQIDDLNQNAEEISGRIQQLKQRIERSRQLKHDHEKKMQEIQTEYEQTLGDRKICEQTISAAAERIKAIENEQADGQKTLRDLDGQLIERSAQMQEITESIARELDAKLKASGYSASVKQETEQDLSRSLQSLIVSIRGKAAMLEDAAALGVRQTKQLIAQAAKELEEAERALEGLVSKLSGYFSMMPNFIDEFLSPAGIMTKKRQIDEAVSRIYEQQQRIRDHEKQLEQEHAKFTKRRESYRSTLEKTKIAEVELKGKLASLSSDTKALEKAIGEYERELEQSERAFEKLGERRLAAQQKIERLKDAGEQKGVEEQQLRERLNSVQQQLKHESGQLEKRREQLVKQQQSLVSTTSQIERFKAEISSASEEISYLFETFEENYARSLHEFERETMSSTGEQELKRELKELKQKVASLGYINHMAAQEFSEVSGRYDFLKKQLQDLEQAKEDLLDVTQEITSRCEALFEQTYTSIRKNFHVMFRRLFGGGRAELKLIDPDDILGTGIDIFAQPPGKKLEKISLLSGGERSMTAVALMFATYLVKPSPFCILDEIDAALDDANIGYFLDILQEFSETSQFIIITHNKKTVLGSASMVGVTMQEAGISKVIAYRLDERPGESNHQMRT